MTYSFALIRNRPDEPNARGTSLRVLEVTTAGDLGRLVVTVLAMAADMELKFIRANNSCG